MPFHIIRQDITKMECDAIINAANPTLLGGGGVDGCIHRAAGPDLLRECIALGGCRTGEAKVTRGYLLPAKYAIHTVGPIWCGGDAGEEDLLRSCYRNSFALALELGCETLAMPLVSSGAFGYPRDAALRVAIESVREFLAEHEMTVYLTVFDRATLDISHALVRRVREYIDDNYVDGHALFRRAKSESAFSASAPRGRGIVCRSQKLTSDIAPHPIEACSSMDGTDLPVSSSRAENAESDLAELLRNIDDTFSVTLLKLIDKKGMTDVECYKKANVSKQTWYKIINERDYRPSKNTVLSFAIALSLSLDETEALLETVGLALSHSYKFDVVIEYFLREGVHDVFLINEMLFKFDLPTLGV